MPAKKKTEVVTPAVQETPKAKRTFRTVEERIAEVERKIQFHQKALEQLESKKAKIGTGRGQTKLTYAKVFAELKASGKTPEEIAEFLNK
jgi:septal ring factor EnvC (AmiA/AmiB activator)